MKNFTARCTIDGENLALRSYRDIKETIVRLQHKEYADVWIEQPGGASLCVLINPERAFVLYLQYEGDSGKHAYDPGVGCEWKAQKFKLGNGQMDEFDASDTIPREAGLHVLQDFIDTGELAQWLDWREP